MQQSNILYAVDCKDEETSAFLYVVSQEATTIIILFMSYHKKQWQQWLIALREHEIGPSNNQPNF
jgi:hypothetical protein